MPENRLKVVATGNTPSQPPAPSMRSARMEMQAKMERLWLTNPEQFNPMRNNMERERLNRIKQIILSFTDIKGSAVDLGCGYGYISEQLKQAGWQVHAVDIASNAQKAFTLQCGNSIPFMQDALPSTKLEDDHYDLVVCTDVIGYLEARDYRLLMAELCRLVKRNGHVICSTPIDIYSEDALQRFGALAETEFTIERWDFSYHLLLLKIKAFFEKPSTYVNASKDSEKRQQEIRNRSSFSSWWYKINTTKAGGYFWSPLKFITSPIVHFIKQNHTFMVMLERLCRFLWSESGISHAVFIGKRRPLVMPTKADMESVERKGKRQVWE